jgi:CubicO group peptidase (beta-lactamase class C family)
VGAAGQPGSVGEFGWGGAYHSTYWADPVEDLAVVYLTQVIPAQGLDDQAKLRALVYAAIMESRAVRDMHAADALDGALTLRSEKKRWYSTTPSCGGAMRCAR